MNIHRKEKAKAKKKILEADPLVQGFGSGFVPHIAAVGYGEGRHVNCQVYMPSPNPAGLHKGNYEYRFFPVWMPDSLKDRFDGNLSQTHVEDQEEEVDLELRLGRLL